ncbi:MAG: hypothetical protein ACJAVM_002716 [Sulfitobacter sp.]|jgi:hypothetical protein
MSSILLSNPFVSPAPPPGLGTESLPLQPLAPAQGLAQGRAAGNSTGFSGSGSSGTSNQSSTAALIRSRINSPLSRPADATRDSVVAAQTQKDSITPLPGANLPKVEMPDPLPTSPFLKRA